mgnify:FL=1
MYEIKQVVGEDILIRYNSLKVEIDRAMEHSDGEWNASQIVTKCITDPVNFHIWEVCIDGSPVAIASTRVMYYNSFTALHITTLGGSGLYNHLTDLIEEFEAKVRGYKNIDFLEYTGRKGFLKQLTKSGWRETYTTMRKDIRGNNE